MGKISAFFTKNLIWKLLSLIFAIFIWYTVINIVNYTDTWSYPIDGVKITDIDELHKNKFELTNLTQLQNQQVKITIKGKRLDLDKLKSLKDQKKITITAEASAVGMYDPALGSSKLFVKTIVSNPDLWPQSCEISEPEPPSLKASYEDIIKVTKKITLEPSGEPAENFEATTKTVLPKEIEIEGPRSLVDTAATAKVIVDITDKEDDVNEKGKIVVVDASGREVSGIVKSSEEADVFIVIHKNKDVPIKVTFVNTVAEGYALALSDYNPKTIPLIGKAEAIDDLSEITLDPIDLSGRKESVDIPIPIKDSIPNDIDFQYGNSDSKEVIVTLVIKKLITKELVIPITRISAKNAEMNTYYNISAEAVSFSVTGIEDDMKNITDLLPISVDVSGLEEGQHQVSLKIDLPKRIKLVGDVPTVLVVVSKELPQAEIDVVNGVTSGAAITNTTTEEAITVPNETTTDETTTEETTTDETETTIEETSAQ